MLKLPLALLFFLNFLISVVNAQPTGALKNKQSESKSNAVAKKPIREYIRYDTIYTGYPKRVEGIKLMHDRTIKDTRSNIFSISEKTEEVMKLHNGAWQTWNRGISGKAFYLYADAKGNVFAYTKESMDLYQLKDSVWVRVSYKFIFSNFIPGADGALYNLNKTKDASKKVIHVVRVWKDNELKPLEGNNNQRIFYEEYMKIFVAENGTVYLTGTEKINEVSYVRVYEWKNAQWKKIDEFEEKYFFSIEQGIDKQNRFFISNDAKDPITLRCWDGNTWIPAPLPRNGKSTFDLSNNLTGDLFCQVSFPAPKEYYQLKGNEWVKLTEEPAHIIPKFKKEVFPQLPGHYYKTEFGDLYDLGTQYTAKKRYLKEYPFVLPATLEKTLPDDIKKHLAQFRLLEEEGKVGLASNSSSYEIIHALFDSIRVEKNYMSEAEYIKDGCVNYLPYYLVLYKAGSSIEVNILALRPRPFIHDQILEGTITRMRKCSKCGGSGVITEKMTESYTPGKTNVYTITDRYRTAYGDIAEKKYNYTETEPGVTTYNIKTGPCNCTDGKKKSVIHYFFNREKQSYNN